MPASLDELMRKYVRPNSPFGPVDADPNIVTDPPCAAALYDWNNQAFAELLVGSDVFVGRRGSGKSSLLRSFNLRKYLGSEFTSDEARDFRERYHIAPKVLSRIPDLVIQVNTTDHVDELEELCAQRKVMPPATIMAGHWKKRMWWLIGRELHHIDGAIWGKLPQDLKDYITVSDLSRIAKGDAPATGVSSEQYMLRLEAFLAENDLRVVVTFDNVEQHKFRPTQNAVLSGLIALAGAYLAAEHKSVDIKLCLPAELFRELKKLEFRPDKDLYKIQYLHWNAAELLHLAARRLRIYLSLWDPAEFSLVKDVKLTDRQALMDFWHRYLPLRILNSVGKEEDTITYLLRHTQMLPRQLILALNAICARSERKSDELFSTKLPEYAIRKGIEDIEEPSKEAILMMFRPLFPEIDRMFDVVMPRLAREFSYGNFQRVWRSGARSYMSRMGRPDFLDFVELMLSTGAIGVKIPDRSTEHYSSARFEFNTKYDLAISDKDVLCVHPLFSRVYNLEKKEELPLILPRGSDFLLQPDGR